MRTKLLGVTLLVSGFLVFIRGTGWHFGSMAVGAALGLFGLLLLTRLRVRDPLAPPTRRTRHPFLPRVTRARVSRTASAERPVQRPTPPS